MESGDTQNYRASEGNKGKWCWKERVQQKNVYFQVRNWYEILKHKANQIVVNKRSCSHHFVFALEHL